MTTLSIHTAFVGIDARSISAYEIFFKNIKEIDYVLLNDCNKAQLCLLDKDAYGFEEKYHALVYNNPDVYILLLSLSEHQCLRERDFFIRKPVKRDVLQNTLEYLCDLILKRSNKKEHKQLCYKSNDSQYDLSDKKPPVLRVVANKSINTKPVLALKKEKKFKKTSVINAGKLLEVENEECFVGDNKDINGGDPSQVLMVSYKPEATLQAIIKEACKLSKQKQQIIELSVLNTVFYFDYEEQKIYSTVGPAKIRPLCLMLHKNNYQFKTKNNVLRNELHKITQENKSNKIKKATQRQSWTMEGFIWLITLWTSRGRIPMGTDLTKPVYLQYWPNLTRLASIPHAVRIAAFLYNQPSSLLMVSQTLAIEQRYVFAFYSASKAIGLSDIAQRNVDYFFMDDKPKASKNKSILAKIFNKLVHLSNHSKIDNIA